MKRPSHAVLVLFLVVILTFPVHNTQAFDGTFTKLLCNVTSFFGFPCEIQTENVTPVESKETATVLPPPALSVPSNNYETVNAVTEEVPTPTSTTVIEEHNTYPTTVVYEQTDRNLSDYEILSLFLRLTKLMNSSVNPSVTSRDEGDEIDSELFFKQVDKIFERTGESNNNVQENVDALTSALDTSITTGILTVSGNTDVGGDLTVDGSITAGMLNVSALASAGALVAPYFTATSTLDVNSFMGAVGIGTTTPSSKLTVVGDIDISTGSAYKYNGANVITASTTLNNYFFGGAGNLTMTGNMNTAIGATVFQQNTTGYSNTAVGFQSMLSNTTGYYNTGFGRASLASNTIGTGNSALGVSALQSNITGLRNNAHGYRALFLNDSGDYNTADGYETLYSNIAGSYNTALGSRAGYDINTATSTGANTIIGYNTGLGIVTGINNTILGANVTGLSSTLSNNIIIADGAGNQRINVDSSGNVGIGTTTPFNKLTVYGDINISDTTTGYKLGNNRILYASTTNFSTLAGIGAGNGLLSDGLYNTALGYQSLYTATSSDNNTAVGYQSLFFNTTGYNNTANGVSALFFNTTGYNNTANGMNALFSNTTGYSNTANGRNTLYSNTTGYDNTANGVNAFFSNTTGSSNTIIGVSALFSNTAGNFNTAIGVNALFSNTTGYDNTANGVNALYSNTTGYDNTALGYSAGRYLTDGSSAASTTDNSLFLGANTKALTADDQNAIVIGYNTNGLGSNTVVLGNDSIVTTALKGNVGIGTTAPDASLTINDWYGSGGGIAGDLTVYNAPDDMGQTDVNVNLFQARNWTGGVNRLNFYRMYNNYGAIGNDVDVGAIRFLGADGTDAELMAQILVEGDGVFGTDDTPGRISFWTAPDGTNVAQERLRITNGGNIGIGTSTPTSKLTVTQSANTATGGFWLSTSDNTDFRSQFMATSGVLSFYGGDTAGTLNTATLNAAGEWTNASDISYKENIEKLSYGLDTVMLLQPRSYDIKNTDNHRIGFIAQEVEEVIPEVVSGEDGSKGISYGNLVAVAISAIQELAEKVSGFANLFKSERIETNTLCVGNTCVTETELQELLQDKLEQSKSGNKSESSTNTDTSSSESPAEIEPVATSTNNLSVELEESVSEDLIVDDFEVEIVEDLPVDEIIEENSVTNLEN